MSKIKCNILETISGDKSIPVSDIVDVSNGIHSGMATAWCYTDNVGVIIGSYNISSAVYDNGRVTFTFETPMDNTNYVVIATHFGDGAIGCFESNASVHSTTEFTIVSVNGAGEVSQPNHGYHVVVFGGRD